MNTSDAVPHVVIVGGGFGGLAAARALKKAPVRVTLVDRRNHHLFQPLLYQVATAALSAPDIAAPIRGVLVEGTHKILSAFPEGQRQRAQEQLKSMGVEILLKRHVTGIDPADVDRRGEQIAAHTVASAAGVKPELTFNFMGMLAWLAGLFVHVLVLVDFRNRAAVMAEWAWAYMTFQRIARVILSEKHTAAARVAPATSAEKATA